MRKGKSKTGTDYFISYDNGKTWETVPHIIPYTTTDHVGYSNSFAFSTDGKTMYAINNPKTVKTGAILLTP
jgi:sugar lactone lactonase YvrE